MYVTALYIFALGTQHYNYLPMYVHSYIHNMYTHVCYYVIVQCVVIASILYCYNYLSSCYLYVRLSVTDNSFTLFPLMVAGLVYRIQLGIGSPLRRTPDFPNLCLSDHR